MAMIDLCLSYLTLRSRFVCKSLRLPINWTKNLLSTRSGYYSAILITNELRANESYLIASKAAEPVNLVKIFIFSTASMMLRTEFSSSIARFS
jgi:hypothetical protein